MKETQRSTIEKVVGIKRSCGSFLCFSISASTFFMACCKSWAVISLVTTQQSARVFCVTRMVFPV